MKPSDKVQDTGSPGSSDVLWDVLGTPMFAAGGLTVLGGQGWGSEGRGEGEVGREGVGGGGAQERRGEEEGKGVPGRGGEGEGVQGRGRAGVAGRGGEGGRLKAMGLCTVNG